jgi:integrase
MARRIHHHKLETRTARLKLPVRVKPYYLKVAEGLSLGYRRNKTPPNNWSMRVADGKGGNWIKLIGPADDYEGTPGALDFFAAQAKARELVHGTATPDKSKPLTVSEAVAEFKTDLESRGADTGNARRVAGHLAGRPLATKIVATLDVRDLKGFRDDLRKKGLKPGAVTRNCKALAAALSLAASHDSRVRNRDAWRIGLAALPGSTNARRAILTDDVVRSIVATAAQEGPAFALLVETLALVGCRPAQARRLLVADLLSDKLLIPRARKGRNKQRSERETRPVPIPPALVAKLRQAAGNRPDNAPLLLTDDGTRRRKDDHVKPMRRTAKRAGLDPSAVTIYALRHSSIVRMLLKHVPTAVVADHHDTSERQIRAHYAKYISEHTDALTRATLLDLDTPPAGNVVALR